MELPSALSLTDSHNQALLMNCVDLCSMRETALFGSKPLRFEASSHHSITSSLLSVHEHRAFSLSYFAKASDSKETSSVATWQPLPSFIKED